MFLRPPITLSGGCLSVIGLLSPMKLGVEVQILQKFSKASFMDPLELTTNFEFLDNLSQEN